MPDYRLPTSSARRGALAWPALALLLMLALNLIVTEGFFRIELQEGRLYGTSIDILNRGAPTLLAALGMTLVIATGGVDLSVGAVLAIAGTTAALLITETSLGVVPVIGLSLAVALLMGVWNGVLVSLLEVQPIVATLVLMVAGRGIAQLLAAGQIITVENPSFSAIGTGYFLGLPLAIWIVSGAYVATGLAVRLTGLGLLIEAVGDNVIAARYSGVNVRFTRSLAYAVSGLCAGLAGVIITADIKAADANNAGLYLELDAIIAVVIGGTALTGGRFTLLGTVLGALIIQLLTTTILMHGVPVEYTLAVKAVTVLLVCLLQSGPLRLIMTGRRMGRA